MTKYCYFILFFILWITYLRIEKGWGCAYRSMQTICSWLRLQGFTQRPDPSILDIQKCLFELGDKPAAFVGSSQWIGAIEICFALQNFYGVCLISTFFYFFRND